MDTRRVFISYSWSDEEHQARVLALAERLRHDGVDVILDKWDLKHGQDTVMFMEQMATDPTVVKVIALIDRSYSDKADQRKGGVGTESQIISKEVYDRLAQTKFLPVAFDTDETGRAVLPTFFKSRFYFDFTTPERAEAQYPHLLRAIFDKPLHQKPALGTPPSYILEDEKAIPSLGFRVDTIRTIIENDRPGADAKIQDAFQLLIEHLESFHIAPPLPEKPFDDVVMEKLAAMVGVRDAFLELVVMLAKYRSTDTTAERLHDAFARIFRYTLRPAGPGTWSDSWTDHYRFFLHELFLYVVASLLSERNEQLLLPLISNDYYVEREDSNNAFVSFGRFRCTADTFQHRNQRLKLNLASLIAETVKQRCTGKPVPFEALVQAELLLFLRSLLNATERWGMWYPTSLVYTGEKRLRLFVMAESKRYSPYLFKLLGVSDRDQLLKNYATANERTGIKDQININHWPISISQVANLENIATRP